MSRNRFLVIGAIGAILVVLGGIVAVPAQAGPDRNIEALMVRLSRVPGIEAKFVEKKHIDLLAKPIVNKGSLHFAPPGRFVRHTREPRRSTVLIEQGRLRTASGSTRRSIALETHPRVRSLVEPFMHLLAGDAKALRSNFVLGLEEHGEEGWALILDPRSSQPVADLIQGIQVRGSGVVVERIRVREVNGDRTVMTLRDVDVSRHYTPSEIERIFRLPRE